MVNRWRTSTGLSAVQITYIVLLAIIIPTVVYIYNVYTYSGENLLAQAFDYPGAYPSGAQCADRPGSVADHQVERLGKNIRYNVTTPSNYRADYPHPLLMVWAPSGLSDNLSERFTGLTGPATARGYIVVHVASVPLGFRALGELATVPEQVIKKWCVAADRVYYTGHSDGGTVSNALAVLPARLTDPVAIAPSAMGMQGEDMAAYECPRPTNVMLMHNKHDRHFPDYGSKVAQWWARCNQCGAPTPSPAHPDCVEYEGCAAGVRTLFCQAEGNHADWPGFSHDVLGFFGAPGVAAKN